MTTPMPPYVPESREEVQFLEAYDPSKYSQSAVTVDVVLLTIRDGDLCVLLVQRGGFPYRGRWALPGGFVEPDETLDAAARRELVEETNLDSPSGHLEQLGTYGDPDRDPRTRIISVAYLGLQPNLERPAHGSDADDARFWRIADIIEEGLPLAFDHARILADGLERAAAKLEYTPLATAFCATEFTMGELRRVYEAVWGSRENTVNFRRKVLSKPRFVEPGEGSARIGAGGGAPGQLYRPGTATQLHPPLLRPALHEQPANDRAVETTRAFTYDLTTGQLGDNRPAPIATSSEETS